MFERFTNRARRVLVLAQEEARLLEHHFIGPEHLLLGLLLEKEGIGACSLASLGVTLEAARQRVEEIVGPRGPGDASPPFTPRAKKVLELSLREAIDHGQSYIGTEHLLLGLVSEGESVATQILESLGVSLFDLRARVEQEIGRGGPDQEGAAPAARVGRFAGVPGMARPSARTVAVAGGRGSMLCSFCQRDLWEVDQYLAAGNAVICGDCVATASAALARAASSEREVPFPARVFGEPPDPDAVAAIAASVRSAFGAGQPDHRRQAIEDYEHLEAPMAQAGRRHPARAEATRLDRVRFTSADGAEVRFEIVLAGAGRFPFDGRVVRRAGHWLVTRDTVVAVLARGGVQVPSPVDRPD